MDNRVTSYGKGDRSRSDTRLFREGLSWQHDWTKDFPEEEGLYMVKYYDASNKLIFETITCFMKYDENGYGFLSTNDNGLYAFFKNQVGVQWKFLKSLY